ncbi:MAG: DUF881 domain-containing protein [Nakamurella sp.]
MTMDSEPTGPTGPTEPSGSPGTSGAAPPAASLPGPTQHPQAEPSPTPPAAAPAPAPAQERRTTTALNRVVVALLCGLLGFAVVLQVQRTASGDTLQTARPDDLVQILDGLQRREDDLNLEIAELQGTLGRLQRSGVSSEEALAEAERQAEALGILTGTVPATGPGVRIVIEDPDRRIPPEVMLDAIQELRNAGAEAFQVGGVRVGVDSAFSGSGGAITLDGVDLVAPYTVTAIGDPPTLAAALAIPGGVFDTVRRGGGTMTVEQSDAVTIDALRPSRTPIYARPTE